MRAGAKYRRRRPVRTRRVRQAGTSGVRCPPAHDLPRAHGAHTLRTEQPRFTRARFGTPHAKMTSRTGPPTIRIGAGPVRGCHPIARFGSLNISGADIFLFHGIEEHDTGGVLRSDRPRRSAATRLRHPARGRGTVRRGRADARRHPLRRTGPAHRRRTDRAGPRGGAAGPARRYYRLTDEGAAALDAEAERLAAGASAAKRRIAEGRRTPGSAPGTTGAPGTGHGLAGGLA